jgi:multiple sugar transport system ATP-binding protein
VVNDVAPSERDIAMVFQSYALYPHMTVAENLSFALRMRGWPRERIAERVEASARMLGLSDLLDRRPAELSGGQRQRVALGRALVRQPQVFLLDEPLSNLDAKLRGGMRVEIARLQRELGTTMVYVTHDQVEAMTLGQRIVVFDRGSIQQIDVPMALYRRPANLFVASFLGTPQINTLEGRLVGSGPLQLELADGTRLDLPGLDLPPTVADGRVVLGIRSEHLQFVDARAGTPASVEWQELVGSEALVHLDLAGCRVVARCEPDRAPGAGTRVAVRVVPGAALLFDPADGRRLAPA